MDELLSIRKVANELGYPGAKIGRWNNEGKVNHFGFSSRGFRVPRDQVERVNQPNIKPTAFETTTPASSGTSKFN